MTKITLLALASFLALSPGLAQAKDSHQVQLSTPIPEVKRTSRQPLDAQKVQDGRVSDPVEQHDQPPAPPAGNGNADPRPASK